MFSVLGWDSFLRMVYPFQMVSRSKTPILTSRRNLEQPWGSVKTIRNNYEEAIISLSSLSDSENIMDLMIRAYDDGIAFRYVVKNLGNTETVVIQDELTEFNLAEDAQSWWIKAINQQI